MILGLLLVLAILWALAERRRANKLSEAGEELENERDEHVCEPPRDEWSEKESHGIRTRFLPRVLA